MARHARDGVIEDDDGGDALIVGDVGKPRHARVHERAVADDGDRLFLALFAERLVEAVDARKRGAHAGGDVEGVEGSRRAQRVAADVAEHGELVFRKEIEHPPVRAARAHDGRAGRHGVCKLLALRNGAAEGGGDKILRIFVLQGEDILADDREPELLAVIFDDGIELFDDGERLHVGSELPDELFGQGMHHAELQDADAVAEDFLRVLIGSGRSDDAELLAAPFDAVEGGGLRIFFERLHALFNVVVPLLCVSGHHDVLFDILFVRLCGPLFAFARFHNALRVRDARAHLDDDGRIELLGNFIGGLGKGEGFAAVGRFQHGELGGFRIVAGILLVLRGMHARVVRNADDHARIHARIGDGEEGVGGDVESDVLHAAKAPLPCHRGAERRFHGDLFVGRPFAVDGVVLRRFLGHFRARGAGIGGGDAAACFIQAACERRIAQHQLFAHDFLSFIDRRAPALRMGAQGRKMLQVE